MLIRVALSLFVVLTLAPPATAQFATEDLDGTWTLFTLRVSQSPLFEPGWAAGSIAFDDDGDVQSAFVLDFNEGRLPLTPGGLTVSQDGTVTGTLGNTSVQGRFLPGQGTGTKTQIVAVATTGAVPTEIYAFLVLIRDTGETITQADATGTWRVQALQVPAADTIGAGYVFGRVVVSNEGEITGGSLTMSDGSELTSLSGNLFLNGERGFFGGFLQTDPSGAEASAFEGVLAPDRSLMVGILISQDEEERRYGLFVLQREPTVRYTTADLAGQWELFSIQAQEDPGVPGFTMTGTITVDLDGTVTGGTLDGSQGGQTSVLGGVLTLDDNGLLSGSLSLGAGFLGIEQATMLPTKDQIFGVDRLVGEFPSLVGLFSLVRPGAAAPASIVQFRTDEVAVPEGTAGTFFVDRLGDTSSPLTVTYTATPLSAVPDLDYRPVSGELSFPAGVTVRSFSVPTLANTRLDGNRSVMLTLGAPAGGAALGRAESRLTILDNDQAGSVRLGAALYRVAETAASLLVSIIRSGSSLGGNVSVSLATSNGSAVSGLDFAAVDTTVTFTGTETVKTVAIPIVNDTLAEGAETFTINLLAPTGGALLGSPVTATATITDNDVGGRVRLERAAYSVTENGGSVLLRVLRSGGTAGGVTVDFVTEDGTASSEGGDYEHQQGTLRFDAGNTSATITIPIRQDLRAEGNETFTVRLGNVQGGATLAVPSATTVTIVDDESAFVLGASAYTVKEGVAAATIAIERTGALATPASVTFTATPGTAQPDLDFTPVSLVVSFPASARSKSVKVPIRNNGLVQGNRTVLLELSDPTGGAQLGSRASGVLTILEDDQPGTIRLAAAAFAAAEQARTLLVRLLRAGSNLAGNVSVAYTTGNGSATAELDYTPVSGRVVFAAGETSKTIAIPLLDDALAEGNETVTFSIFDPDSGAALGTPATALLTIVDDDKGGVVRLGAPAYRTAEGNEGFGVPVIRSGGTAGDVAVDYAVVHGTTDVQDLTASTGTIVFAPGQTVATIPIPIGQDDVLEAPETFTVLLGNARGGATLGAPAAATVTITDDDVMIEFNRLPNGMLKFQGNRPEVVRTGLLSTRVTVEYVTTSGTAILGQDYVLAETGTLVFLPGRSVALLPLTIIEDLLAEGPETFTVTLFDPSAPARLGENFSETFIIQDDDFGGQVQFDAEVHAGREGETVTLTLQREGGAGTILPVTWSVVGGNASAGTDFTPASGEVTFGPTETTRTIALRLTADALLEGPESAFIALAVKEGGAELGPLSVTELRIVDTTVAPASTIEVASPAVTVVEGDTAAVTLRRLGDLSGTASVEFTLSPGTATAGEDYVAAGGVVTFAANASTVTVLVQTVADQVAESAETFGLTLANPSAGAALGQVVTAVVTIEEAAGPGYTFTLVAEATGSIVGFAGAPAINNAGAVAFRAFQGEGNESVYTTVPGTPTPVATTGDGRFTAFSGNPPLADSGEVAFRAFLASGGTAVYRAAGDGSSLDPVAVPDTVYAGFGAPRVSPGGRIGLRASLNSEAEAVLGGTLGGGLFTIDDTDQQRFAGYGPLAAPGDLDSQVVFAGTENNGDSGLYLSTVDGESGTIVRLVDGSVFTDFGPFLSINNQGRVAFHGFQMDDGETFSEGIFVAGGNGSVQPVVTTGAVFATFGNEGLDGTPTINDQGAVAFHAFLADGGSGIFTGPDAVRDKVIATGDPLLGSTVDSLVFGGMNNAGQLVFRAFLSSEREVIVVATPGGAPPAAADLAVTVTSDLAPGTGAVTYAITVVNLGPDPASDVQVTLALPPAFSPDPPAPGVLPLGGLLSGAAVTQVISGVLTAPGDHALTATVTASAPADPNPANNTATVVVTVTAPALAVSTEGPLVGVGRTIGGTVTLASPAPAGGLGVTLAAAPDGLVSLAPATLIIAEGASTGSFSITGVAVGDVTLTATAEGFQPATAQVTVTGSVISLGALPTLGLGQSASLPISLSTAAPAGGVTVSFGSSTPGVATVTPSVFIPGGAQVPAANPQVTGVNIGAAQINASAVGFAPDSRGVNVSVSVTFAPATFGVVVNTTSSITVTISAAAPAGGLTLDLASGNTSIATVVSSVTVPAGQLSVPAAVTGVVLGTTTLQASGGGVSSATATINVTPPPPITVSSRTIGRDLQEQGSLSLGAVAPLGGVQVTLASADPSRLLLSTSPAADGSSQVTLAVNAGAATSPTAFFLQALDGTGTVQVLASAPGYANGSATVTLVPSGFVINSPGNFATTTLSGNTSVQVVSGRLLPGSLIFSAAQPLRGGFGPVSVDIAAADQSGGPGVGAITGSPLVFDGNVLSRTTAFDPAAAGTSRIAIDTPAGFSTPAGGQAILATVDAPDIGLGLRTIGRHLQETGSLSLEAAAPAGGVLVTLTSADPARLLLSTDPTVAGSDSITLPVNAGAFASSTTYYLQALDNSGTVAVLASAPGYAGSSTTMTLAPSGFFINSPGGSVATTTLSGNTSVQVVSGRLVPGSLAFSTAQPIRGGFGSVSVNVTATDQSGGPGVGTITGSPLVFDGNVLSRTTAFDPAVAGTSLVAIDTPPGFSTPGSGQSRLVTVDAPAISVPARTVGHHLQEAGSMSLGAPAPAGGLLVTLTSTDPARLLLSTDPTVAGSASITLPVNAGASSSTTTYYLQALASSGSVAVLSSAPGYAGGSTDVTLAASGFVINNLGPTFTTTTFSAPTLVQVISARLAPGTLNFAGAQAIRGGFGPVNVAVTAVDVTGGPGVGAITASPLVFDANVPSRTTTFDPAVAGTARVSLETPAGFTTPGSGQATVATVTAPAITVSPSTLEVGRDLQQAVTVFLQVAPPGPVTVTVSVASTAIATLSTDGTVAGNDSVTFTNVTGTTVGTIFVQGRTASGSTTLRAQAPGYADGQATVQARPSGFVLNTPSFTTSASAANTSVQIIAGRLNPATNALVAVQQVRGGVTVSVPVTATDQVGTGVGTITVSPVVLGPGASSAFTQFDPATAGTALISVGAPPGFDTPAASTQITATVLVD